MRWIKHTWNAILFWIDLHGRLATVMTIIIAFGGATLAGKASSIWANVKGVYFEVVVGLAFAIFLGSIGIIARMMGPPTKTVLANREEATHKEGAPNITWTTVSMQKLVFENGRFRRFVPYESAPFMLGMFMVVTNKPSKDKSVISAGDVKAHLLFKLKQGEYEISPGAWVDEPYSSVRLDVGDTRHLIIAVSESYLSDWKMVANRRTSEANAISTDYSRDFPLLSEGFLEINLISLQSETIIRTWKARIKWPREDALDVAGIEES